ncbi:putative reverse transcriptase domain-containing protein, partial [Tanacetum coccineum]
DPTHLVNSENQKYEWGKEQEAAFQTLKNDLCDAPILFLPDGVEDFVVYCDASNQGLGCVLMQRDKEHLCLCLRPGDIIFMARRARIIRVFSTYLIRRN